MIVSNKKFQFFLYKLFASKRTVIRYLIDKYERNLNRKVFKYNEAIREGWSFIIITAGKDVNVLNMCVKSIIDNCKENIDYEIIVVGIEKCSVSSKRIKTISYHDTNILPGWITLKKNIGAKASRYTKLVFMHDYVQLLNGWFESMNTMPPFDICLNQVLFMDGRRARDFVFCHENGDAGMLPYGVPIPQNLYINGTYFVVSREFYLKNQLLETLRWGESEDIEWSRRVIRNHALIIFCKSAVVKFLKDKPLDEAPYNDKWYNNTCKEYEKYGFKLTKRDFTSQILKIYYENASF